MNISGPFVRRPVATTLLALALCITGVLAMRALPVAPLPRIDFPTVQVQAGMPGASPETMAAAIATPLERRLGRIAGLTEMTSTSSQGSTNIGLQFDLGRNVEAAARDVQAAIAAASADLPTNLPTRPSLRKVNPADAPILVVGLTSATLTPSALYEIANTQLAQKLAQVRGAGQVFVGGGGQPAIRVQADVARLAAYNLTLQDVRLALQQQTASLPKGALLGGDTQLLLAANDQIADAAQCRRVIVAYRNAGPIALQDVATVSDDVEDRRVAAWFDGERAVLLIVRRQPGANIIETVASIKEALPKLLASISPAISFAIGLDRSTTISAAVHDVQNTLLLTIALVVLVVFVFLRDVRATLVPSVAVPLSLLATFAAMYLCDYSLDNLSLMALTICTGFVVDDAIVVTENIMRHMERGLTPYRAALLGAQEVGFTVVSMTASLVAVFIPILLMAGVVGRLFREFAAVLSLAVLFSAVISLTVTPAMCAQLLRAHPAQPVPNSWRGRLTSLLRAPFDALEAAYARRLGWALRHGRSMLAITAATVACTIVLFGLLPKGLFPQQDTGMLMGSSEAAQDASFAAMLDKQRAADAIVREDVAVKHVLSFIGGGGGGGGGSNSGTLFVSLKPRAERAASADAVVARLRRKLRPIVGLNVYLQASQDVRIGGRAARTQYQYTLQDAQLARLRTWAPKLQAACSKLAELRDVASDQQTAGLQSFWAVDRDLATAYGLTSQGVDDTLYDAFGQRQVVTRMTEANAYRTLLEADAQLQSSPQAASKLWLPGRTGPVPLMQLARLEERRTALAVNHQGQLPAITLSFNLAPGVALSQAVEAIDRAKAELGVPAGLRAEFQGTAQAFQDTTSSLPWLLVGALVAVYIVLGILYESFVHPLTILSTLPSAGLGALVALWVTDCELSIIAFIGIVLLIGIVKKNAIMVVDFAIVRRRTGNVSAYDAIFEACLLRFRPILMTTLAALFAGIPLAIGQGDGAELRRPLGIAIVGGLMLSQLLTLFTTPVVYLALERLRRPSDKSVTAAGS